MANRTVLLVDDEDLVIDVGVQMLEKLGYSVLVAKNGEEAIDVYHQQMGTVDLVILDMVMPGISGGETYDKLREIDSNAKILLSSGYSMDGLAEEIMARGCDGFIQKPFGMTQLYEKILEINPNNSIAMYSTSPSRPTS